MVSRQPQVSGLQPNAVGPLHGFAENGDKNSRVVKLKGLSYHVSKQEVVEFFCGLEVIYVHFVYESLDGRPSGLGFVEFETPMDATLALKKRGHLLHNRHIKVLQVSYEEMLEQVLLGTAAIPTTRYQPWSAGAYKSRPPRRNHLPIAPFPNAPLPLSSVWASSPLLGPHILAPSSSSPLLAPHLLPSPAFLDRHQNTSAHHIAPSPWPPPGLDPHINAASSSALRGGSRLSPATLLTQQHSAAWAALHQPSQGQVYPAPRPHANNSPAEPQPRQQLIVDYTGRLVGVDAIQRFLDCESAVYVSGLQSQPGTVVRDVLHLFSQAPLELGNLMFGVFQSGGLTGEAWLTFPTRQDARRACESVDGRMLASGTIKAVMLYPPPGQWPA